MSISMALSNALTSLNANQQALNVLSQNIANANTENYSRQIVSQAAQYLEGFGAGVKIDSIFRRVDKYLERATQEQLSAVGQFDAIDEYYERMQILFGQPGTDSTLNAYTDEFFATLQDLADNPDRASLREAAMRAGVQLTGSVSTLAREIEDLRFEADQDVYRSIQTLNAKISELYDLNITIGSSFAADQNMSGLYDQRDALIRDIADIVDVQVSFQEDGSAFVYTAGGYSLVDYERFRVEYAPAQSIEAFIGNATLSEITIVPIDKNGNVTSLTSRTTLVGTSSEGSVDTRLKSGRLLGLLQTRDIELPKYLNTLDELAKNMRESMNVIHNQGAGFPPPAQLTGQVQIDPTEIRDWSGLARFAVVQPDGQPIINPYDTLAGTEKGAFRPLTLDFNFNSGEGVAGRHSVQTFVDEFNAHFGTQTKKTAVGEMNDIKLVSSIENNPAGTAFSFDFDLENISKDDQIIRVVNIGVANGVLASALPNAAGNYTVASGREGRTGTEYGFDITSTGGVMTISVDVEIEDPLGAVSTSTLVYTVDPTAIDIKNNRYVAAAGAVGANDQFPTVANPIATARFVDIDGNPVSAGELGYVQITTTNSNYRIAIDEATSRDDGRLFELPPELGSQKGLSHYLGLNNFFDENNNTISNTDQKDNSAINLKIRDDILANSSYISTGVLTRVYQPANPVDGPLFAYEVGAGSKAAIQSMADLGLQLINFDQTNSLPTTKQTFSGYAAAFVGVAAAGSDFAGNDLEQAEFFLANYVERKDAMAGVNVDEELANTIIYQNIYAASARVINVTKELFDELLSTF